MDIFGDEESYTDRTVHEACGKPDATCKCPSNSLLPPLALAEVQKVLEFGAKKYSPHGWKTENTTEGDMAALKRHLASYDDKERYDHETTLHALSHLVARALFVIERDLGGDK